MQEKYYITTPIYYPSDKLHIGHSYTTVAADAMARFKRMLGYDVMFLTGMDEHGQKIQQKAEEVGVSPKEYVDKMAIDIKKLWNLLEITNDKFIRTTDDYHEAAVKKIFKKLFDKGDIYKGFYEGWYCTPCESFWTESQLVDGKCPDCGREVQLTKEESYFFKLSNYTDKIIKLIEDNPHFMEPEKRRNEMLNNFLRPGLEDLCVSRTTFDWGVKVDFDPEHVVYVWIDALTNYITALGYLSEDESDFEKYWPANVHLVGKEIVRFHTIIWPAMLMALDLPLPKQVFGHGWLLLSGGKMSKSKGNVVDPVVLVDKYGVDAIRYFLLREVPFGSDGLFSNESLINRMNSDLANDLGNLVSRTTAMAVKYFDGILPEKRQKSEFDEDLKNTITCIAPRMEALMDKFEFSTSLKEIWAGISRANKYIDETMPWVLAKDKENDAKLANVLYNLLESIRIISILITPFMPVTPDRIYKQIKVEVGEATTFESAKVWGGYKPTSEIEKGEIIFPRIDVDKELAKLEELNKKPVKEYDGKEMISIDDFSKLDLRVAKVIEAEKIKKSDKLLKLKVLVGDVERQIVSGIAKNYKAEDLIGKKVIVVYNLMPVNLRGIQSQGMLLAASDKHDIVLAVLDNDIEEGSIVS